MLTCETCHQLIADALYDALDPTQQQRLQLHLDGCESCRNQYADIRNAVTALEARDVGRGRFDDIPERVALDGLWDKLQPELNRIDAERYRALPGRNNQRRNNQRLIGAGLALAASLALIIAILPLVSNDEATAPVAIASNSVSNPATNSNNNTANTMISPELMDYLTRAEVMLLLVANAETQSVSAVPIRQTFARDMAIEASALNTNTQSNINSGQSRLLQDIEFLLLQIANLDSSNMEQGVQLLQQFIEENSVLFKIRLLEMQTQETFI